LLAPILDYQDLTPDEKTEQSPQYKQRRTIQQMPMVQFLAWSVDTNHSSKLPRVAQFCKPHHALHLKQNVFANFCPQQLKPQQAQHK
jgi:hypothetical protein